MSNLASFPKYGLTRQVKKVTSYRVASFPYLPSCFLKGKTL
mgnify:CR=1 FL=1